MQRYTALGWALVITIFGGLQAFADPYDITEMSVYELMVRISPEGHSLEGNVRIKVPEGVKGRVFFPDGFAVEALWVNGREFAPSDNFQKDLENDARARIIRVAYRASFDNTIRPASIENMGVVAGNSIDESGLMLLSGWHPIFEGPCIYQLTVEIPSDFEVVSEGDTSIISKNDGNKTVRFHFPHPLSGLSLAGGKYEVREEDYNGIAIRTYFFPKDGELAEQYLSKTKDYLELYESLLGKYPYQSFSIVENSFQTGYSFPTYTLLGSRVVRLPFIVNTSLGHEILHQWFGNHVYVAYENGNWSEGLTSYLAEHWYDHKEGAGAAYRKKIMIDYGNYVDPDEETTLRDFRVRKDFSTSAVGYGKGAMVFHMLRKELGDKAFFLGLRDFIDTHQYQEASWDDMEQAFLTVAGEKERMRSFFDQWINRKGVPSLALEEPAVTFRKEQYRVSFDLVRTKADFTLRLPVRVVTTGGDETFVVEVDKEQVRFSEGFAEKPLRVVVDENYDVMRSLTAAERPPVISAFTGRKDSIVVIPEVVEEESHVVVEFFRAQGYRIKEDKELTDQDLKESSLLLLSPKSRTFQRFFSGQQLSGQGLVVKAFKNPLNHERVVVVLHATRTEELTSAYKKIFRYGNYSYLRFEEGNNQEASTADADKGISVDLEVPLQAVATTNIIGLQDILEKIGHSRIIYVGEKHDQFAHHLMQLEIIRSLYESNQGLIIGMEMFQRPFQKYLDQYIRGEITEEEFLRKTEYFKRWGFDYNLYRDILQYAQAHKIPVIALNLRKEIIKKVSREGISSLTEEEYGELPQGLDMSKEPYRESLKEVYLAHSNHESMDFGGFFQSQVLWDETMALSVAEALEQYPSRRIVVLAGNGHLRYAWGIPDRVTRLTKEQGVILLNGIEDQVTGSLAHFLLLPEHRKAPPSPKLGLMLEEGAQGVLVKKVMKGGAAAKAGIKEDDLIGTIAGNKVRDIADIRIILMDKERGESVKVGLQRKRLGLWSRELQLEVVL